MDSTDNSRAAEALYQRILNDLSRFEDVDIDGVVDANGNRDVARLHICVTTTTWNIPFFGYVVHNPFSDTLHYSNAFGRTFSHRPVPDVKPYLNNDNIYQWVGSDDLDFTDLFPGVPVNDFMHQAQSTGVETLFNLRIAFPGDANELGDDLALPVLAMDALLLVAPGVRNATTVYYDGEYFYSKYHLGDDYQILLM